MDIYFVNKCPSTVERARKLCHACLVQSWKPFTSFILTITRPLFLNPLIDSSMGLSLLASTHLYVFQTSPGCPGNIITSGRSQLPSHWPYNCANDLAHHQTLLILESVFGLVLIMEAISILYDSIMWSTNFLLRQRSMNFVPPPSPFLVTSCLSERSRWIVLVHFFACSTDSEAIAKIPGFCICSCFVRNHSCVTAPPQSPDIHQW